MTKEEKKELYAKWAEQAIIKYVRSGRCDAQTARELLTNINKYIPKVATKMQRDMNEYQNVREVCQQYIWK